MSGFFPRSGGGEGLPSQLPPPPRRQNPSQGNAYGQLSESARSPGILRMDKGTNGSVRTLERMPERRPVTAAGQGQTWNLMPAKSPTQQWTFKNM